MESDVTLTCIVELTSGQEIDIPLDVNFELLRTDPAAGSSLNTTAPFVSGSTYTSTATINSFGREHSGEYSCRATISSEVVNTYLTDINAASNSLRVTTGTILKHKILIDLGIFLSCK